MHLAFLKNTDERHKTCCSPMLIHLCDSREPEGASQIAAKIIEKS